MTRNRNMDSEWLFHYGEAADAFYMAYDDRAWRRVTLPHDWAVEHPFDTCWASGTGYLPGGTGWYRKHFTLTKEEAEKRIRLTFEGVYKHARVWINSNYLGQHAYGYTEFSFDLTPFVREGENVIALRAEHEDVADSRWYTGSGIDRHVRLTLTDETCFAEYGITAVTLEADGRQAKIRIRYEAEKTEKVRFFLKNAGGKTVAEAEAAGTAGEALLRVRRPKLWSTEDPYLYTLRGEALRDGGVRDAQEFPFGIRVFRFDADQGFFLNGRNMKLKGVCVHHDAGCLGAAVPGEVWAIRLKKLKAIMTTDYYHISLSTDVVGIESAVALKNGYALAIALSIGLNQKQFGLDSVLHFNSQAGIFGQSVKEMYKLLAYQGAATIENMTVGAGDLYVTVYGGRTRLVGILLGRGMTIDEAKAELNGVTLESLVVTERVVRAVKVAAKKGLLNEADFPMLMHVDEIITEKKPVDIPWEKFTFQVEQ